MEGDVHKLGPDELLGEVTWARDLAVRLVGEAFADDVLQETRLAAWRSGDEARDAEGNSPRPWLRVVLTRFALQVQRSERARRRREQEVSRAEAVPSPAELLARLEGQQRLGRAVSELPEPYRSTLLLRYSEGLRPKEIARRLGLPGGTVRWRLKSGLDLLRTKLDEDHAGDRSGWMAAMIPLLRTPSSSFPQPTAGLELATGSLVMKKWIVMVAAVLLVAFGGWQLGLIGPGAGAPEPGLLAERELPLAGKGAGQTPDPVSKRAPVVPEEAVVGNSAPPTALPGGGWWLVGSVGGIPPKESELTRLRILASGATSQRVLRAGVEEDGTVRVDLARIFRSPEILPEKLTLVVSHPGKRDAEQVWTVDRDQRQAGFMPEREARFEVELRLSEPFGVVRGEVFVPDGYRGSDVSVLLIPDHGEGQDTCQAIDQQECAEDGSFALTYALPGQFHVVARHRDRLLRPNFMGVAAVGGTIQLDAPLGMDEGAVLEGVATLNGGTPAFELNFVLSNPDVQPSYCSKGAGLTWYGDGYHYSIRFETTQPSGRFRVTGMAPGGALMRVTELRLGEERIRLICEQAVSSEVRVRLPGSAVVVNFDFQVRLFECVGDQLPLENVMVVTRFERGSTKSSAGRDGRVAVGYAARGPLTTIEFGQGGYEKATRELDRGAVVVGWERIELVPTEDLTATLVLTLEGDAGRSMERFSVLLLGDGQAEEPGNTRAAWQETLWKRTEEEVRVEGVPPGMYRVVIAADDPSNGLERSYPDTNCMVLVTREEVELAPGEERGVTLRLRVGGRLWLAAVKPEEARGGGRASVRYRVLDLAGEEVESHWVTESGPTNHGTIYGGVSLWQDCFLEPPLEAGEYALEVWSSVDEGKRGRYPFRVVAGEVTRLRVEDPR